jgi:hypothetical protein
MEVHSYSKWSTLPLPLKVHAVTGSKEFIPPIPLQLLINFKAKVNHEY